MTRTQTLGNSTAQKLRTLKEDVEALPDPGTLWTWNDGLDAVGPSALEQLKALDAVEKVSPGCGGWWRVSPRVSEWMDRVHDVRPRGSTGQDTLPVGRIVPGFDARDDSTTRRTRGRQVTLTGDPVTVESGSVELNVHSDDEEEDDVPPQRSLDSMDEWIPDSDGGRWTVSFDVDNGITVEENCA